MYKIKLKEIRINNNLLQKDLAKVLNISEISYTHYESEYYLIPTKYLIILADYFKVSIDYIFEFVKQNNYSLNLNVDLKMAGKRLKEFRKEHKLTQEKLALLLNTNRSVIANYERGRNLISTPFLYTICDKYKVSADYLLGRIGYPKYYN